MDTMLIDLNDDLEAICEQIQPELWGMDNEMPSYQPEHLKRYLESGGVLIVAHDIKPLTLEVPPLANSLGKIMGVALCYVLPHPDGQDSFYIDQLDTHPDYRRQGVATQLIQKARQIAKEQSCTELWVGTETKNAPANAFYRKQQPYEVESAYIYTYKVDK